MQDGGTFAIAELASRQMILDRYSEDLFFLEDFECLQINQEHFVKNCAFVKQVVVDEMVNMGNIYGRYAQFFDLGINNKTKKIR